MNQIVTALVVLVLASSALCGETAKPGETLQALMLDSKGYSNPVDVRQAFSRAKRKATDPKERQLIQLVSDVEVCLYAEKGLANPSQCTLKDSTKYGYYSDFAKAANKKLNGGSSDIGVMVKCAIDALKASHADYQKCLGSE